MNVLLADVADNIEALAARLDSVLSRTITPANRADTLAELRRLCDLAGELRERLAGIHVRASRAMGIIQGRELA